MRKKTVLAVATISISLFVTLSLRNAWGELKVEDEAPGFILSSTPDKEVDYYRDYYGKHHLILTFVANAFGSNCTNDSVGYQGNPLSLRVSEHQGSGR